MYQRWVQTHQQYIHWLGQKIVAEANENNKIKKKHPIAVPSHQGREGSKIFQSNIILQTLVCKIKILFDQLQSPWTFQSHTCIKQSPTGNGWVTS